MVMVIELDDHDY